MSFQLMTAVEKFSQKPFQFRPYLSEEDAAAFEDFPVLGNLLSDLEHFWQAKGPCLEVRLTSTGRIVGSFTFGSVLKDTNTKIVAVEELKRNGDSLLVVALDCALTGGSICVFDIFGRGVLRAVRIGEKISSIYVIDHGCDRVFPESSPLQYFDGLLAVGTVGGDVFLLDLCKQICENVLNNCYGQQVVRGEVNNCQMNVLNKQNIHNIKKIIEISVEREEHLAIHLNAVLDSSSEHFILKGEEGDDRVHVNKGEAEVSAFFYTKLMASLFIGYNFGSFQMWDLCSLDLLYTSPLCDDIIPITNFTIQEPADDPKSVCYIWVSFSHNLLYGSGLPYAVMYAFYFHNETHLDKYGSLYEDFQHCSIRFQLALGDTRAASLRSSVKGGICLGLQSINENVPVKDHSPLELCLISWLFWDRDKIVNTAVLIFDLNQWYKAQMPTTPNWMHCSNYIIKNSMDKKMLSIKMHRDSLRQFMGIQKPEEHFCPTSLSFNLCAISEHSVFKIENECQQKIFLNKVLNDQHLALVNPVNFAEEIMNLGLAPLFYDTHNSQDVDYQRELLLNVMLEQDRLQWLCEVASELANNAFSSAGLTLYNMIRWAFQRALKMKTSCDKYCEPLFDYSGMKLDKNILHFISNGQYQIKNLWNFYNYISSELWEFVADKDNLLEERNWFKNVVEYFEVLLWMVGVGLLPEFEAKKGTRSLDGIPYLVQDLTEMYDHKRAQLRLGSDYSFVGKDCSIFIDKLINSSADVDILKEIWQADGGSGLYPPPSLESLLKTYLVTDSDLVFKHFLVNYTLMDIATTLDKDDKVIEMLFKFPQVVDLSKSNMKIIQGFWHLDHGNYETALDCVLDESIRPGDLEQWHHSVMLKTLLTQNKSNLAVRYLQARNPAIHEEIDLLTVISILVSKKLLDDAFEFRLRHRGKDDSVLLNHIFNECNKNGILKPLLCRSFTPQEEHVFLKYLQSTRDPNCEELRIFYYLVRSRFLDAFDAYDLDKKRKPDNQGLIGQREASASDNLIQMYKSLMPEVYSQLIELVRKERANLWIDAPNPRPMSVFVHNPRENVKYKSNFLFAALSKSKQSFGYKTNEIVTEEIPFLRTLVVPRNKTDESIPVIKFKAVGDCTNYYGSSPPKKRKLSPEASKSLAKKPRNSSLSIVQTRLATPIVKKDKRQTMDTINDTGFLPQSILKSSTILENSGLSESLSENYSSKRSTLGLSPRSSVKSILKPHVQFSDAGSVDGKSKTESSLETSGDDVFYSPEHSFEGRNQDNVETPIQQSKEKLNFDDSTAEEAIPAEVAIDTNTNIVVEENVLQPRRFESPKCRRSYRKSLVNTPSPIRSSPRLAKKSSVSIEINSAPSSPSVQKPRGRQSLSRAVLENNLLKSQNLQPEENQDKFQLSCSSISDMSFNDSSLVAFLGEDQGPQDSDISFETENVEVVSKVIEISRTEIHRESLKMGETGNIVSTRETKEEFHSKTVEEFKDDLDDIENSAAEECDVEISHDNIDLQKETVDKDDEEHLEIPDDNIDSQKETVDEDDEDQLELPLLEDKDADLHIYDDLSSASEDGKQALQNVIEEKQLDLTLTSVFDQKEVEEQSAKAFDNDFEMQEVADDIPETEKAFIVTEEVIEINSSSEEDSLNVSPQLSSSSQNSFSSDSESQQILFEATLNAKHYSEEDFNQTSSSEQNSDAENPSKRDSDLKQASSEYSSYNSEDPNVELPKNDDSYDSDAPIIVKHVVGDDDSSSKDTEVGVLEQTKIKTPVEEEQQVVEENPVNSPMDFNMSSKDTEVGVLEQTKIKTPVEEEQQVVEENPVNSPMDFNMSEEDYYFNMSEKDENSDVDASAFDERIVTPTRRPTDSSDNSQMTDKSRNISPQDVAASFESSESHSEEEIEASEKQSRSIQCTLAKEKDENDSPGNRSISSLPNEEEPTIIKLRTVKKTYGKKGRKASEEEHDDEEPNLKESIGLQCSFEVTPNVEEKCIEATTIKVKTVKRTYKSRKVSVDVDATPKLAVSLPTKTYSKKLNVRLFEKNEEVQGNIADIEENVVTDQEIDNIEENVACEEIIDTDKDMEENNENEEIVNIDEAVEESVAANVAHEEIINANEDIEEIMVVANNDENIQANIVAHEEIVNTGNQEIARNIVAHEEIVNTENQEIASIEIDDVNMEDTCSKQDEEIDISQSLATIKEVIKTSAAPLRITRRRSMLMSQESSFEKGDLATIKPNDDQSIENIPEHTPIRMTRHRSMLMSREPSECSDKTSEKDYLANPQSTTSSQSSERKKSQRFMKFAKEKLNTSPLGEDLEEKKAEVSKKKGATPKQKTTRKRTSKKILSDIDAHISIDSDQEHKTQKPESTTEDLPKSTKVYAKRTTKTSKSGAPSATKRTRSLSTDQPATRKRNLRTKSVDLHNMDTSSEKKELQIVLTAIPSSKSRRTRSTDEQQKLPAIEEIDPITLLNKVEFRGQPDPEEAKVYEEVVSLPPSPGSLRQTRSGSVLSNVSSIKTRLRRASADTMSVASEVSNPSPPKRHKKKEVGESSVKSVPCTRSRSNSVSSSKPDTTSAPRNTRARSRLASVLEDIQEEKKSDEEREGVGKSNVRKRGRKRKE